MPTSDGSGGHFLKTNGSGTLTWSADNNDNTTYSAGSGLDLSSTTFSVDVSDFMTNGSNNRIVTATGADAMNAEANLTFDGTDLTIASTGKLLFNAATNYIHYSGESNSKDVLAIVAEGDINMTTGDDFSIDITDSGSEFRVKDDGSTFFRIDPQNKIVALDDDASIIKFGDDLEVTLTHVHDTGLLLNGSMALQFNDATQNIKAPNATTLDINATDEIELNATLIDMNGNVEISGNLTVTGNNDYSDLVAGDIPTLAASQVTEISNLTAVEGAQLENIGSVTISNAQWGYLGAATGAITNTDTNTQLSTEQVQDIVGAMFSGNTETRITGTYQDGDGTIDLVVDDMTANDNTNQLTTFTLTGDSGSNQTIEHGNTMDIAGGNAITTVVGSTDTVTINHDDTSSQASVNNSGTTAIQDITLDTYGHVTGITSADVGGGGDTGDLSFSATTMSGNGITLDSAADIVLDAAGDNILLKDAGATFGSLNNASGGLNIKSGTTTVSNYDSSGNMDAGKWLEVKHFGHSNLDSGQSTYFSWCSTNSNQSDIFNHRGLMPCAGKIIVYNIITDGALSGGAGPGANFTITGSSTSSDVTFIDGSAGPGSHRFQSAASNMTQVDEFAGYTWDAGDKIVATITPTTGSNSRAAASMIIQWSYNV
tara:strand:+ start:8 stop:1972 length:1965 start_codon:yes stop_codon:yes gene_type:complete